MTNIYITDMDGTLTKGSVVLQHAGHLIEKGLIKDDGSYHAWLADVKNESLIVAVAENYRKEIMGLQVADLDVENFVTEMLADEDNWYETLDELVLAQAQGHRVIIISGSSDFLVEEVGRQLQFEAVGTRYHVCENNFLTGEVKGMFGLEAKDEWITENVNFADYENSFGLGDTVSDFGIFKHTEHNTLVEPTRHTMEYVLTSDVRIERII